MDDSVAGVEEFLVAHGAGDLDHPGGTLLEHLRRTHDVLSEWGAREALRLAGLAHAAYGTDGFPHPLIEVGDRPRLAEVVGAEAEEIVYTYGGCARDFTYPLLSGGQQPRIRDRFTGEVIDPTPRLLGDFVELTFANELDVFSHNEDLRVAHGDGLRRLLSACRPYASEPACAAFTRFFGAG